MHTIRLREPWQREWTHAANPADATRPARYHRYFHRPSGLLDRQPVTLVLFSRRLATSTASLPHGSRLVTSTAQLRHGSKLDSDSASLPHGSRLVTSPAQLRRGSKLDSDSAPLPPQIILRSLLLNSHPLQVDVQTDNSTQATHLSVCIDSALEPYNQLEIACEFLDYQPPIDSDSKLITPPPLTDWAEVQLEIHD